MKPNQNYDLKNREYECKLCHKMNRQSYVCHDCKNALRGITRPQRKRNGKPIKRQPNRCRDCNCIIVRRGLTAKRCGDCTAVNNQLRNLLCRKVRFVNYKINQLQTAKEQSFGSKRRLENLLLSRQHLLGRLNATYANGDKQTTN